MSNCLKHASLLSRDVNFWRKRIIIFVPGLVELEVQVSAVQPHCPKNTEKEKKARSFWGRLKDTRQCQVHANRVMPPGQHP